MAGRSSIPPITNNVGAYVIAAFVFLCFLGGLFYFASRSNSDESPAAQMPKPPPPPVRSVQFHPDLEMPEDEPEPVVPAKKKKVTRVAGECTGQLETSQVQTALAGDPRRQVQTCYERRLKENNILEGSMTVVLTISTSGEVSSVNVKGSLDDPQVFFCVKKSARQWKFPKPKGGCVQTSIPFKLTPKP